MLSTGHAYRLIVKRQTSSPRAVWTLAVLAFFIGLYILTQQPKVTSSDGRSDTCVSKVLGALAKARQANAKYRAFVELITEDVARREGERLDGLPKEKHGRLHCLIVAVKDNIETSTLRWELRTTAGSASLLGSLAKGEIIKRSAPAVETLEKEGAIVFGKTNMDDFALQYHSFSTRFGQTLNCHDTRRYPGGSSGGSAVAVSLGLVDFALGTDTGGSIRIPSSFAGVVSLRPAVGSVSTDGVVPLSHSRDTVGPLCLDIRTCRLVFQVIRGDSEVCEGQTQGRRFKVGIAKSLFTDQSWNDLDSAIKNLGEAKDIEVVLLDENDTGPSLSRSALLKQTKSASMYEFKRDLEGYLKSSRKLSNATSLERLAEATMIKCESVASGSRYACNQVVESMEKKVSTAGSVPSSALTSWSSLRRDFENVLKTFNLNAIAFPAFTALPTLIRLNKKQQFCPNNRLAAITGVASLVMPGGMSGNLPVGLEIVGLDECMLFEIGQRYEKAHQKDYSCAGKT